MTYSIIGRDRRTGEIGIACQSRWFDAGRDLAWIESGAGAVCTQGTVEARYGSRGLALMREGRSASEALDELLAADGGREVRQVAMADAKGAFAQHTGTGCVVAAGHAAGPACCAQGNMLARATSWEAMVDAFADTEGNLGERLLSALDAAESEGGDARGHQSARILIRPAQAHDLPRQDRVLDVRVVDHPDPVAELRRLVRLKRAYDQLDEAIELAAQGELMDAAEKADTAHALAPADDQIMFWRATILGGTGRIEEAVASAREATQAHPGWPQFLGRCVDAGLLPPEAAALVNVMG